MDSRVLLEARPNRRAFIGGSDARIIMGEDEAACTHPTSAVLCDAW